MRLDAVFNYVGARPPKPSDVERIEYFTGRASVRAWIRLCNCWGRYRQQRRTNKLS